MCDATHHELFGVGLMAIHEVLRRIVYILDNVFLILSMYIQYTVIYFI